MITFNKSQQLFMLTGKNYTYAMYVNNYGYLRNVYYGEILPSCDNLMYMVDDIPVSFSPQPEEEVGRVFSVNDIPLEYSAYGRGDFRIPSAIIRSTNGSTICDLQYKSHFITKGAVKISGMPCARYGGETLTIVLIDKEKPVEVYLQYVVFDDCDVIVRNVVVKNIGNEPLYLDRIYSFCLDLPFGNFDLIKLQGAPAFERNVERCELSHGISTIQSLRGASSHMLNPFLALVEKVTTEQYGNAYGFNLIYSGSFAMHCERNMSDSVRVTGGIQDNASCIVVEPNDCFETPQATMVYSNEGIGGVSRQYADFIRAHIVCEKYVYKHRPIVVNNWESTYFDFDEEKILNFIKCAGKAKVDVFVMDDGWFGNRNDDTTSLGDWYINRSKLPNGLKTLAKACKEEGIGFGLWFEPEMVSKDSELFKLHPDWALGEPYRKRRKGRNQYVLDFSRKEVVDYVFTKMCDILDNNDICYIKWDMNRYICDAFSQNPLSSQQGDIMHRHILGVYNLAERLTTKYPNVFFEGCAGGGGRFDLGMLYYFPQIWASDLTDAYQRSKIQYGTSLAYPLSSISCHFTNSPNDRTKRLIPSTSRFAMASMGAYGYEFDLTKYSQKDFDEMHQYNEKYKNTERLILEGDLYRLASPFEKNMFCQIVVSKDKKTAYLVGLKCIDEPDYIDDRIRIYGLDDERIYYIDELNVSLSGKYLRTVGLVVRELGDFESFVWHFSAK